MSPAQNDVQQSPNLLVRRQLHSSHIYRLGSLGQSVISSQNREQD